MRVAIALCAALTLTACSASQMMRSEVDYTFTSTKSADALEECISLAMSSLSTPQTIRGEGRRTLTFGHHPITVAAITIIEGQPNTVEVRGDLHENWDRRITGCA